MGLMMLAAGQGTVIEIKTSGPDADDALEALCQLVANKFDEE
jgi:phosphocarrier protein HPr